MTEIKMYGSRIVLQLLNAGILWHADSRTVTFTGTPVPGVDTNRAFSSVNEAAETIGNALFNINKDQLKVA